MSHGEVLKLDVSELKMNGENGHQNGFQQQHAQPQLHVSPVQRPLPNPGLAQLNHPSSSTSVNEYKNVMNDKPDYFKASVMVRSQSSSSNTSR